MEDNLFDLDDFSNVNINENDVDKQNNLDKIDESNEEKINQKQIEKKSRKNKDSDDDSSSESDDLKDIVPHINNSKENLNKINENNIEYISNNILSNENEVNQTNDKINNSNINNNISSTLKNNSDILNTSKITINDSQTLNSTNFPSNVEIKPSEISSANGSSNSESFAILDTLDVSDFSNYPKNPAIEFPFILDEFQRRSIIRLEEGRNVLVCAHTSSGKTVVAEYGIAMAKKKGKRCIYTSPIKALSNQKYREFKQKFDDVGILTGDVSINPDAQCLIMTTEILQSSLYKNNNMLNSVEWVIFDEVHYINDKERGHVWEEILILLPKGIGLIMLSATIPNHMAFAEWVGQIKRTKVYVQSTLKRVVPLEHIIYIDKNKKYVVKTVDEKVNEKEVVEALSEYKKSKEANRDLFGRKLKEKNAREKKFKDNYIWFENEFKHKNYGKSKREKFSKNFKKPFSSEAPKITLMHHRIWEIVHFLNDNNKCPAVIFVFSIKRITEYAKMLSLEYLVDKAQEKKIIDFFDKVVSTIPYEDKDIIQIKEVREILKSGIGVHHSGLLPILKETIEILFQNNLIRVLFATTSFSIGLNMPTKSVVFTDIHKHDDNKRVILSSSEYLQMCGRAGRRGIDEKGQVYILPQEGNDEDCRNEIIDMLKGTGTEVESQFRINYRTILAFFSRNSKSIEVFFKESFRESQSIQDIPNKMKKIRENEKKLGDLKIDCKFSKKEINEQIEKGWGNNEKDNFSDKNENNMIGNEEKNSITNKKENNNLTSTSSLISEFHFALILFKEKNRKIIYANSKIYDKLYYVGRYVSLFDIEKSKKPFLALVLSCVEIDSNIYHVRCIRIKGKNKENISNNDMDINENNNDDNHNKINNRTNKNNKKFNKKYYENLSMEELKREKGQYYEYLYEYFYSDIANVLDIYENPVESNLHREHNRYLKQKNDYDNTSKDMNFLTNRRGDLFLNSKSFIEVIERMIKNTEMYNKNDESEFLAADFKKLVDSNLEYVKLIEEREKLINKMINHPCYKCPKYEKDLELEIKRNELIEDTKKIKEDIKPQNLKHYREFETRCKILEHFGYIDDQCVLTLKGKAAREIGTTDCILVAELLTSDILSYLSDSEIAGFVAGFAGNKNEISFPDKIKASENVKSALGKLENIYKIITTYESDLNFEEDKYNRRCGFDEREAIEMWMNGGSFCESSELTELEEGKLYNLIMRIFLFLEEISNFYKVLGNMQSSKRMLEIKKKIMKGIMSLQSLYLQTNLKLDKLNV